MTEEQLSDAATVRVFRATTQKREQSENHRPERAHLTGTSEANGSGTLDKRRDALFLHNRSKFNNRNFLAREKKEPSAQFHCRFVVFELKNLTFLNFVEHKHSQKHAIGNTRTQASTFRLSKLCHLTDRYRLI